MEFKFNNLGGEEVEVTLGVGDVVFIIGANGSGKSSLVHKLFTANRDHARRISAHRQTWFQSNTMDMTASAKKSTQQNMLNQDARTEARWMDHNAMQRASVTIFELIDSENIRARKIAGKLTAGKVKKAKKLAKKASPLATLNELLLTSNLDIQISIENDEQLFARKGGGDPYSIAELSDGERNALLIIANVLTAPKGSLIIIDEPERHLHTSIVSPLLLSLFQEREDCAFVISTHDLLLAADSRKSSTLLVRECKWDGKTATGWDTDLLVPDATIVEDIRLSILGGRRKILFVEGDDSSLDRHIYSILYPAVSVGSRGNCIAVERAVTGIRGSEDLHWIEAYGLIDRDVRSDDEVAAMADRGIFATQCYSVESLYYCDVVMQKVAERQAEIGSHQADLEAARQAIVQQVVPHKDRLCEKLVTHQARIIASRGLPTAESLQENPVHTIEIDTTGLLTQEQATFDGLVNADDNEGIVMRYPVRETGALGNAAVLLGFTNRQKYEDAVRKMLSEDEEVRNAVKQKLAALTAAIEA